jgi:transcriptional regulator with XRE-family HTH domain
MPHTNYKPFGAVVRQARRSADLTLDQLAEQIGTISRSGIGRIERGSRHSDAQTARALVDHLGLDSGYLMRWLCELGASHSGLSIDEFTSILNGGPA